MTEQQVTCPECKSEFPRWNGFITLSNDVVCSRSCRDKRNAKTIKLGIEKLERERNAQQTNEAKR